jgi:hypothetical protein
MKNGLLYKWTNRQLDKQATRQEDEMKNGQLYKWTNRQLNKQVNRQLDKQTRRERKYIYGKQTIGQMVERQIANGKTDNMKN